jgi:hypothetical protein
MFLGLCFEQWSWTATIISALVSIIILALTIIGAILVWRYKHAPRINTGIVVSTDTGVYGTGKPLGLRIRDDLYVNVRTPIINLTRNITKYTYKIRSWFDPEGPYYYPVEKEYRGDTVRKSRPGEAIEGHFFINLSSVLSPIIQSDKLTVGPDVNLVISEYFTRNIFYVSTKVVYVGFLPRILARAHEPTFEYYFVPNGQIPISHGPDTHGYYSIYIPGQWVPGRPR